MKFTPTRTACNFFPKFFPVMRDETDPKSRFKFSQKFIPNCYTLALPESSSSWLVGPLGVPKTEEDSAGRVITRPKDARNPDPRPAPCFGALPGSCRPRPWRYASFFPVFKPTHVRASRVYSSPSSVPSAALTNKQPSPLPTRAVLAHSWC